MTAFRGTVLVPMLRSVMVMSIAELEIGNRENNNIIIRDVVDQNNDRLLSFLGQFHLVHQSRGE